MRYLLALRQSCLYIKKYVARKMQRNTDKKNFCAITLIYALLLTKDTELTTVFLMWEKK